MIRNLIRQSVLALLFLVAVSAVMAQSKIYYVTPTGTTVDGGWTSTTTLTEALNNAKAGDQIWVQGSESGTIYTAPAAGFTLKSGVQLYGGFKGDELSVADRETLDKPYQMKYRSVLSGDISRNDIVDNTNLIFPANTTRSDNATHVLSINMDPSSSGNNNAYPTVVNGFSIGGGQADGADELGGGIYIYGDNSQGGGIFRVERCFFVNNYATRGGAIYVDAAVKNVNNGESLINQCVVYNNAAGERAAVENEGGGIYLAGEATVVNSTVYNNENGGLRLSAASKVVNSTVARNTGAGIDMIAATTGFNVFNTIVWGNTSLSAQYQPRFKNSAYHEVASDDADGNVYVAKENRGEATAPMFDAPSVKTSFDRDFDWKQTAYPLWSWNVLEGSVMIDKGDDNSYQATVYGNGDMAGNTRQDGTIDIGAYEFQKMPASRVRYVKKGGTGDGSSWTNASGDLQKMIDELATNNPQNQAGEVWVAAGTYAPQSQLISGTAYSASFRMRDGISVYGGFAGTETTKQERAKGTMPWDYNNVTILEAAYYDHKNLKWNNNKWTLTSDSRHVVWFAPMSGEAAFSRVTTLDGVTIRGGYAQGGTGLDDFLTDRGAGVYMDDANAYLTGCVVKENYATGNGGGVYVRNGRVETSLIYNNNADADGGAVYVENRGLVLRSMLANNSAHNGAGVYLHNEKEATNDYPEYLILSTCVVSNNTMTGNGAVYCDKGGVLMQNTIVNNNCVTATDATDSNASQTGGIYIDEYALVVNSVIWNNQKGISPNGINIPMYVRNPSAATVRFSYNAISGVNNAVWNNTFQEQTLQLVDENAGMPDDGGSIGPRFTEPADLNISDFDLETNYGVQSGWADGIIGYYWKPIDGSNLWARGMPLGQLPDDVVLTPEIDLEGALFTQKPAVGAFMVTAPTIVPSFEQNGSNYKLVLYIDAECTEPGHDGSSWATAFRSLNDALAYCAALSSGNVTGHYENNPNSSVPLNNIDFFEIHVLEGDLWPRYAFTNNDPKTATVSVPATASGKTIYIYGGYHRDETDPTNNTAVRDPLTYRSVINGNTEGKDITQGLYHCITVQQGARLVLDGFHVVNGYAAGEASRQYGAGLLAHAGSEVTVRNCIFENNTAQEGAAIDAREATLALQNCVVNNNTNTDASKAVINAQTLTMKHVTVVNNIGAAPENTNDLYVTSFSAGNSSNNTQTLASAGEAGAKNFANPTNGQGATLGFDTYLGGYAEFRPLTSSTNAAVLINKATGTAADNTKDITTQNSRDLGGASDLGAYEAILPESGRVIYVRTDGDDSHDGLSWEHALKTVTAALNKAEQNTTVASRPQIWVAEGTYTSTPGAINDNMLHGQPYAYKMVEGVNVYGGFPDSGSPGEDDRNPQSYETILQPKDSPTDFPTYKENGAQTLGRVLVQEEAFTVETVWDGFTICNGYLNTHYRYSIQGDFLSCPTENFISIAGAGALLLDNGVLENCKIENNRILSWNLGRYGTGGGSHGAGGGVYCYGGTIKNCQIINNHLRVYSAQDDYQGFDYNNQPNTGTGSAFAYGGGLYMQSSPQKTSSVYNTVISGNTLDAFAWSNKANYHTIAIGAGVCQVSGNFYNNTIVGNTSNTSNAERSNVMCGGVLVYTNALLYNCIIYNNKGEGGRTVNPSYPESMTYKKNEQIVCLKLNDALKEGTDYEWYGKPADNTNNLGYVTNSPGINIYYSNVGRLDENNQPEKSTFLEYTEGNNQVTYESRHNTYLYPEFVSESGGNYRLDAGSPAINSGTEAIPSVTIPDYDAEYTARIKDCGIDMGAFESTNESNISFTTQTENGQTVGIYYVSQNGAGLRSGQDPNNAACAMKLQDILTDAGNKVKAGTLSAAIVKVAGYENAVFVYHANTLASSSDPQSYTYVVPEGVTLMGGYYDGTFSNGVYQKDGWDDVTTGEKVRNPMKFQTVLSAISEANNSTIQTVNGYHAVTFGAWPGTAALNKTTIIDGLFLIDGSATSTAGAGNPRTRGGGAIVPSGAHVRNCVVKNCEAIEGGGLYLLSGATVSGTAILENSAEDGGGVYADNTGVGTDNRAHILSCTIANNEASSTGGGLYMEEGAVMNVNTVIFDNRASSDKNVSGVVGQRFEDTRLATVFNISRQNSFYPFNNCFVETQEMPSDFENSMLESDKSLYFADDYYRLKDYALMIKHGMKNAYQTGLVNSFNVAEKDMQDIDRIQTDNAAERLDAGAFAYEGGILPTDLFTRIFVSPTTNVTLPAGEDMKNYLGRSFYTSFSTLEDALGYIRSMREKGTASADTKFEILVAGGTYKPSYLRTTTAAVDHDQKLYSFVVPQGVSIYGGFSGTEEYSSGNITSIPTTGGNITVDNTTPLTTILNARNYSDFNQNGIYEPWELANQTILSGQINASSTAQNAYHVVFTQVDKDAQTVNPVVLDGLTVMYGQTDNALSVASAVDEKGRGGGIYSNGVTYTISRCRLLDNTAVRGGAVFVRDADLNLSGCILAGNKTVANEDQSTNTLTSRGGAAYVSGINGTAYLRAVNTLWSNNESEDEGGAIGTNYAGVTSTHDPFIYIMNNTFVRNKADKNPVLYNHNAKSKLVNTLIWGNEGNSYDDATSVAEIYEVSHSASDVDYVGKFASGNTSNNILLSTDNMGDTGPRFANPSAVAGVTGNSASNLWNPVAISVLTDSGDGTEHTANEYPGETGHAANTTTGAYQEWFGTSGYLGQNGVTEAYITGGTYSRYSGPRDQNNNELCKSIDIGLYEYQYISNFSTMPAIYVDTISRGTGSGDGWVNATDDLRGAIAGAANPTDNVDKKRVVYVRDGNYSWDKTSAGSAYILNMLDDAKNISLTLKGSCTGSGEQQDFSKQTVLRNDGETTNLMSVSTNSKPVTIEGFTFINDTENTGTGINASTGTDGSLTLKNCGFRKSNTGLKVSGNDGNMLIYNTLFADGGTGLNAGSGITTVVNATFANNATDYTSTGTPAIYNSVAWKNGTQNLTTYATNNNVAIAGTVANDNINEGPNFRDPDNADIYSRDYRIRPSVMLLNKGSNESYTEQVGIDPANDRDLGNNARLVDTSIDVGAYEYEAPLQPIVYVKADLTGIADGKSWETALGDLQGAVDLAGLYANNNSTNGYVFVHGNYNDTGLLNLTLKNTKVYGGMNDERSSTSLGDSYTTDEVKAIVSDLLTKRKGMLEAANRSSLENVTIGADGVLDGFEVTGTTTVNDGVLSTSVVKNDVGGAAAGLLYNSLVLGSVNTVKAVNVTATGTIADITNNRASATGDNTYVTDDYWNYQLMETATDDIDNGTDSDTESCIDKVGHSRDLIGNARIRNTVDNGCFETWNICENMTSGNVITSADYPVGKSVVYVRKGQELKVQNADDGTLVYKDAASAFNPGFLLLEHQAGLRGNGNYISLTNFAVERDIPADGADLVAMPFDVNSATSKLAGLTPKRYDGSIRAAYDYKFDDGQSTNTGNTAWTDQNLDLAGMYEGLLFENTTGTDQTLRFYGKNTAPYIEDGKDKTISLQKYNFNEPWTSETTGGNRFTHKENMSWNLFGSPYLCAMNYSDLAYGRMLYGYNNGSYQTVKTYGNDGTTEGHIPAGSAVFTQTATLKDAEVFAVAQPTGEKSGTAFSRFAQVQLVIESLSTTKSADQSLRDDIGLSTVTPEFASTQFDLGSDGVKWMAGDETIPQIYMQRDGGRYSLLSAVNVEGSVEVGVRIGEPGDYLLYLPEKLDLSDYSSILLTDRHAGKMVDLKQGSYAFTATRAADMEGRFSLSFNRSVEAVDLEVKFYSPTPGVVIVEGLPEHARVNWYTPLGRLVEIREAANWKETFYLRSDIYMMEVYDMAGKERIGSYKVRVR